MMIKHAVPVLVILLLAVTLEDRPNTANLQSSNRFIDSFSVLHKNICRQEPGTFGIALKRLSSGDYNQSLQARRTLLNIAHQSNDCRQAVVQALMEGMDQPNLDFERQPSNYYLWRDGSQLLGELNAVEALDLLISHLDLTNGFHSSSMVFQPAILGVTQMGKAAIPKLTLALKQNPRAPIRMAAAYCLTNIGGVSAMNALTQAQEGESSSCVANFIRISLNTFTYKSKSGISFDTQAPQANADAGHRWLRAFECVE